jgi:uncharacterized protein (DUF2336 family)
MPHNAPAHMVVSDGGGSAPAAGCTANLLAQLEDAIANKQVDERAAILRRITDLFMSGSQNLAGDQIALFDDVMARLVTEVDNAARTALSQQLAVMPTAPANTTRLLALDESIAVAGPVLSQSDQLDEDTLVESAKTKSQAHLLAISRRNLVTERVTDILVERGNQEVVHNTAANKGARFSNFGYSTLVDRSQNDEELATRIWLRPEVPRHHLLALFSTSSEALQNKLIAADRTRATLFLDLIRQASDNLQTRARQSSATYAAALAEVRQLQQSGDLNESQLLAFARAGKFDETASALSIMCELPIGAVERALVQPRGDQLLVLSKAIGLSWVCVKAILLMCAKDRGGISNQIEQQSANYRKLTPETARTAIQFYRLRQRASNPARS